LASNATPYWTLGSSATTVILSEAKDPQIVNDVQVGGPKSEMQNAECRMGNVRETQLPFFILNILNFEF